MAVYERATWCTRMCARVCAGVSVISGIKYSLTSLHYFINYLLLIYPSNFLNLCHVGLSFSFNMRM